MASAEFEAQRNNTDAVAVWLLHIHFDAFFELDEKDFYFSSTTDIEFPVGNSIEIFTGELMKDIPKGRHQKDRNNDYCEFSFVNEGNATYLDFLPYQNILERGKVTIFHCLEIEKGYFEGETRFVGYLKDFTVSESDKSLKFTAFSDMSRTGFPVGARILTRERCGTEFNFGGLNPPEFHRCGWQLIQGGNPNHCSKFLKGVDSCTAHGNAHRFFAVTALASAIIEFVPSDTIDFPYENNPCFTERNFLCDIDWNIYPISFAKKETFVKAFDIFTGEIVNAEILEVNTHIVDRFSIARFDSGARLEVTLNHLFRIKASQFAPIGVLTEKQVLGRDKARNEAKDVLKSLTEVNERTAVYSIRTSANTHLITDARAIFYFDTHNQKQQLPIDN